MEKTFELSYKVKLLYSADDLTEEKAREMAVRELWENHNLEVRACDLKNERESIDITWAIEDVQQIRPDLTDDQAYQVLLEVLDNHDAEYGVGWETLRMTANFLFPCSGQCTQCGIMTDKIVNDEFCCPECKKELLE